MAMTGIYVECNRQDAAPADCAEVVYTGAPAWVENVTAAGATVNAVPQLAGTVPYATVPTFALRITALVSAYVHVGQDVVTADTTNSIWMNVGDTQVYRGNPGDRVSWSPTGQVYPPIFQIDAQGVYAGRSAYDNSDPGFVYLSTDGDAGATTNLAVLFIRTSSTPGTWSSAVPFQGPVGPEGPAGPAGPSAGLSDTLPQALGVAAAGTASAGSRADHVHTMPTKSDVGLGNVPNVDARERSTHTGTQLAATISDFNAAAGLASGIVWTGDYASPSLAATAAYAANKILAGPVGVVAYLDCNPSAGDDLQAMVKWAQRCNGLDAGGGVGYTEVANLRVRLADGFHSVNTNLDVYNNLAIVATGAPTYIDISSVTITNTGTNTYEATVVAASALPSYVAVGYAIGMSNVQGDNGADALNGGQWVSWVAANKLSFKFSFRSYGPTAPTSPTSFSSTPSLGLTPNQIVVPRACLFCNSAGWDGAAREGFLNVLSGYVETQYIGFSYNGTGGDAHDMLFAMGRTSRLRCELTTIAGAGQRMLRSGYGAQIYLNQCHIGAGVLGTECYNGGNADSFAAIRTMFSSGSATGLALGVGCQGFATQCVITGCVSALRTTYEDSSMAFLNGRITRCTYGIRGDAGVMTSASNNVVNYCTNPSFGRVVGTAPGTLVGNTNQFVLSIIKTAYPAVSGTGTPGSIGANATWTGPTITVPGAALGDIAEVTATAALPDGCQIWGQVTAADTVKTYVSNLTGSASSSITSKTFYATITKRS